MMPFDSFTKSPMDAFTESLLHERGASSGSFHANPLFGFLTRDGRTLGQGNSSYQQTIDGYACEQYPGFAVPSLSATSTTGQVRQWFVDTEQEIDLGETPYYAGPGGDFFLDTIPDGISSGHRTLTATTGSSFGTDIRLANDVLDARYVVVQMTNGPLPADVTEGAGACTNGWIGGDPDPAILTNLPSTYGNRYMVFTRTDWDQAWTRYSGPWVLPAVGVRIIPNETTLKAWAWTPGGSDNTLEVWDLNTDYAVASITTVTLAGGVGNINGVAQWGKFTVINTTTGDIVVYHETTLVGNLGSPLNTATWTWLSVGWDWILVTQSDKVEVWQLDDSGPSVTHFQTLDPGESVAGATGAVIAGEERGTYFHSPESSVRKLEYDGSAWSATGAIDRADELVTQGYSRYDHADGYVLMYDAAATPTTYYVKLD